MTAAVTPGRRPANARTSIARHSPRTGGAPRRLIVPIACLLALVTGAWFGQAYALLSPSEPIGEIDAPPGSTAEVAWRFYDAIDHYFRAGDDAGLRAVLSPYLVDHVAASGADAGQDGFLRYLANLRESHPSLRLAPYDVVAQHGQAVARIALEGADNGAVLGAPLSGLPPWPEIEIVRVEHGQVVERWGSDVGYGVADPLLADRLAVSVQGDKLPLLRRVTFAPGANDWAVDRMVPAIVLVESGTIEADLSGRDDSSTPGTIRTLVPGSTILVSERSNTRLSNRTDAQAVVLLLSLGHSTSPATWPVAGRVTRPDSGVTEQELANNGLLRVVRSGGKVTAELARVTLAPGTHIAPHAIDGVEIAVVEEGVLTLSVDGSRFSGWLRDPNGRSVMPGPYAPLGQGHSLTISRLLNADGEVRTSYRNDGDRPVTFLFVRLRAG